MVDRRWSTAEAITARAVGRGRRRAGAGTTDHMVDDSRIRSTSALPGPDTSAGRIAVAVAVAVAVADRRPHAGR
ncbi:hypothetical protein Q5530_25635 [Saccharothrix sp. BKS2]|uniref:hypothetical protein n=1 Tax=Saccharothrix sp. BKS2 TaxID=3064400 RepID=UPI0039EADC4C